MSHQKNVWFVVGWDEQKDAGTRRESELLVEEQEVIYYHTMRFAVWTSKFRVDSPGWEGAMLMVRDKMFQRGGNCLEVPSKGEMWMVITWFLDGGCSKARPVAKLQSRQN